MNPGNLKSIRRFFRLIHPEGAQLSSSRHFHMMVEIYTNPGITVDDLARKIRRNRSSAHKWMLELSSLGWIEIRRERRGNNHHTLPYVTPAGLAVINKMGESIIPF